MSASLAAAKASRPLKAGDVKRALVRVQSDCYTEASRAVRRQHPPVEKSQGLRTVEYTLLSRWTTPAKLTTVATGMTSGATSSVSGIGAEQSLLKSGGHWQ